MEVVLLNGTETNAFGHRIARLTFDSKRVMNVE